jgi:hypothetical protein
MGGNAGQTFHEESPFFVTSQRMKIAPPLIARLDLRLWELTAFDQRGPSGLVPCLSSWYRDSVITAPPKTTQRRLVNRHQRGASPNLGNTCGSKGVIAGSIINYRFNVKKIAVYLAATTDRLLTLILAGAHNVCLG